MKIETSGRKSPISFTCFNQLPIVSFAPFVWQFLGPENETIGGGEIFDGYAFTWANLAILKLSFNFSPIPQKILIPDCKNQHDLNIFFQGKKKKGNKNKNKGNKKKDKKNKKKSKKNKKNKKKCQKEGNTCNSALNQPHMEVS